MINECVFTDGIEQGVKINDSNSNSLLFYISSFDLLRLIIKSISIDNKHVEEHPICIESKSSFDVVIYP